MSGFAPWISTLSQRTNFSLAGSRVWIPANEDSALLRLQMAEWGLIPTSERANADLIYPELPEARQLTGHEAWDRAAIGMSVSSLLAKELASAGALSGIRIACSLIVEPKTAVLLERLSAAGAEVGVYCHAHECDQRIAQEIAQRGYTIEANANWTPDEEHAGALRLLDRIQPNIIIDDGANLARLLVMERPELLDTLIGVAEETTSGVRAFQAMLDASELPFPVVAVNDSPLKTHFDNRHGTGESCTTTTMALLGDTFFAGAKVCVIGYGPVGEGFARRVRTLGAHVTVVDTNPERALEATFAGFAVASTKQAIPSCDLLVSATGVRHTVSFSELKLMRNGAAAVVIGGIANEIALDEVVGEGGSISPTNVDGISELCLAAGHTIRLLAAGDGVNYAAGPGNPIQIMDLSFAVQICAVEHLVRTRGTLPTEILRLAPSVNQRIAACALEVRGIEASNLDVVSEAVFDWRCTRYVDTVVTPKEGRS